VEVEDTVFLKVEEEDGFLMVEEVVEGFLRVVDTVLTVVEEAVLGFNLELVVLFNLELVVFVTRTDDFGLVVDDIDVLVLATLVFDIVVEEVDGFTFLTVLLILLVDLTLLVVGAADEFIFGLAVFVFVFVFDEIFGFTVEVFVFKVDEALGFSDEVDEEIFFDFVFLIVEEAFGFVLNLEFTVLLVEFVVVLTALDVDFDEFIVLFFIALVVFGIFDLDLFCIL